MGLKDKPKILSSSLIPLIYTYVKKNCSAMYKNKNAIAQKIKPDAALNIKHE